MSNLVQRLTNHLRRFGSQRFAAEDIEAKLRSVKRSGARAPVISQSVRQYAGIKVLGFQEGELSVAALRPLREAQRRYLIENVRGVKTIREIVRPNEEIIASLSDADSHAETALRALNADPENSTTITHALKSVLFEALTERASDIHINRSRDPLSCWLSYRIDGVMGVAHLLTPPAAAALTARIKNESGMDFSDTRTPQDGRLEILVGTRLIEVRSASLPIADGEGLTMRLIDPDSTRSLEDLYQSHPDILQALKEVASLPPKTPGLALVTGPTGSGKSTLMYGVVAAIDREHRSVVTVEDPIEQKILGARQTQLNLAAGVTYPVMLKAHLRADVDVIVIGEIRDSETAEATLRAAESGHLIMSTLHTSNAIEALHRLQGMLPEDFLQNGLYAIGNHLRVVVNQRLAKKLCGCAHRKEISESSHITEVLGVTTSFVAQGCENCRGTGFLGRTAVPEAIIIPPSGPQREEFSAQITRDRDISKAIGAVKYVTRVESCRRLVEAGEIDLATASEILGI